MARLALMLNKQAVPEMACAVQVDPEIVERKPTGEVESKQKEKR